MAADGPAPVPLSQLHSQEGMDRAKLMPWFERFDAIEYAQQQATHYAEQARHAIANLPASPSLRVMEMITDFVVLRSR